MKTQLENSLFCACLQELEPYCEGLVGGSGQAKSNAELVRRLTYMVLVGCVVMMLRLMVG